MKDRKVAARYARALLAVLRDPAQAESADRFLIFLGSAMDRTPEFRRLMLDPSFSADDRRTLLLDLARRQAQPAPVSNFLSTIVEKNRTAALASIAQVFHEERERAAGIVAAELTTARPLADDLKQRALKTLEKLTGRSVRMSYRVEPGLIGGAVTRVGSEIYDGSLRTQLIQLRRKIVQE